MSWTRQPLTWDKVKVLSHLSNYGTKKNYNILSTGVDLDAKINLITVKSEADKKDINKIVSFPTSLNNVKADKMIIYRR